MPTTLTPITAKVLPEEKKLFAETTRHIGTTPSNAIRMFIAAFNNRGAFPFDISNPYGFNAETLQAIDDSAYDRNMSRQFDDIEEMIAVLNAEN